MYHNTAAASAPFAARFEPRVAYLPLSQAQQHTEILELALHFHQEPQNSNQRYWVTRGGSYNRFVTSSRSISSSKAELSASLTVMVAWRLWVNAHKAATEGRFATNPLDKRFRAIVLLLVVPSRFWSA